MSSVNFLEKLLGGVAVEWKDLGAIAHPITHKSPPPKLQPIWVSTQGDGGGTGR